MKLKNIAKKKKKKMTDREILNSFFNYPFFVFQKYHIHDKKNIYKKKKMKNISL